MARPINTIRKLTRIAKGSLSVVLPAAIIRNLGWREHQKLQVKRVTRGVLVTDARTRKKKR